MPDKQTAPYGSWRSPVTSDLVVAGNTRLGFIRVDGEDVYWTESRPEEGGRYTILRWDGQNPIQEVLPHPLNARTTVHEYGGLSYAVHRGILYFTNFQDQRIYRLEPGKNAQPVTPSEAVRYADLTIDPQRKRIIAVREDHRAPGSEPVNSLVSLSLEGEFKVTPLAEGHDFYASPAISPDGRRLAWISWNHPNMPWDGTELWTAELNRDGSVRSAERIAGGLAESVNQPQWSPDGALYFVSDFTSWWNLYRWRRGKIEPVHLMKAEFSKPLWQFGLSTYDFDPSGRIFCTYIQSGTSYLASIDPQTGELETLETPYQDFDSVRTAGGRVFFTGGSPHEPNSIVSYDPVSGKTQVIQRSSDIQPEPGYISMPRAVAFPTGSDQEAYGFFYPPQNRDYQAPADERPPLIVIIHGGPTSATTTTLKLSTQFWTSRGFGVFDVNYRGSTGYGRAYRQQLNEKWGVADVEDCVFGARHLVEQGLVDGDRLIIRGGSAGGYTTLSALTFYQDFDAGASYYGISDLEAMVVDTHKFESRYTDRLIGPYPERKDLYEQRSPIHYIDQLKKPLIIFQGLEDRVVPPSQAERMVEAVKAKGLPVAYIPFEGEQHGFRKAETIKRSLEAELYFYGKVFGFEPADPIEPVPIENLPEAGSSR